MKRQRRPSVSEWKSSPLLITSLVQKVFFFQASVFKKTDISTFSGEKRSRFCIINGKYPWQLHSWKLSAIAKKLQEGFIILETSVSSFQNFLLKKYFCRFALEQRNFWMLQRLERCDAPCWHLSRRAAGVSRLIRSQSSYITCESHPESCIRGNLLHFLHTDFVFTRL